MDVRNKIPVGPCGWINPISPGGGLKMHAKFLNA